MKYVELKEKQSSRLNNFEGIFYAFSNNQFDDGMKKIGLDKSEIDKIYSLGVGCYVLKTRLEDFKLLVSTFEIEMKSFLSDKDNLLDALDYELSNYEFIYSCDPTNALDALSIKKEDIPQDVWDKAMELQKQYS